MTSVGFQVRFEWLKGGLNWNMFNLFASPEGIKTLD